MSTGVSPFFLTHGWEQALFNFENTTDSLQRRSPVQQADALLGKLKDTQDFVQVTIAAAQDSQERQANTHQDQAIIYKVNDKV